MNVPQRHKPFTIKGKNREMSCEGQWGNHAGTLIEAFTP